MSIVEVKEPLVFIDEELCWFVLKSPDISNHRDFHVILTDLTDEVIQALKGFFLLLKKCSETTRAISVCLALDFSKVPSGGKFVDVYKSLLQNIGPEVTELRLSGMKYSKLTTNSNSNLTIVSSGRFGVSQKSSQTENTHLNIHPFAIQNPLFSSTLSLPHLHTIRIANLGGKENIMWLSYFLHAARNLKQLFIGPFDYVQVKELGRLDIDNVNMRSQSTQFARHHYATAGQLRLLGQCTNFEKTPGATLFITMLSSESDSTIPSIRANWDGTPADKIGLGIPLPVKVQVDRLSLQSSSDSTLLNLLCTTNSLIALRGLNCCHPEPKLSASFNSLAKLEIESTASWLLDNLEHFPSLKHLVWQPNWTWQGYIFKQNSEPGQPPVDIKMMMMSDLRARAGRKSYGNLEIFRIVHDWRTCQSLPDFAFQFLEFFSLSFPHLKILSCEVSESEQVSALFERFTQVKEFHFNKYIQITEFRTERAPPQTNSRMLYRRNTEPDFDVSYKLENFRQKMTSFKQEVDYYQNVFSKDEKFADIKFGAFIYFENLRTSPPYSFHNLPRIEMNLHEICVTISNLKLSEVIIPVPNYGEAVNILEAIKSTGPNDLKHVHFQILRGATSNQGTVGIPQHIIDSYEPFFLVTFDFEQGKNNLSCSSLVKDFWE